MSISTIAMPDGDVSAPGRPLTCAVITPVGPGHAALAEEARASVEAAFAADPGPFSELVFLRELDLEGARGRSQCRNDAIDAALARGVDWLFFLDADDLMAPDAFAVVAAHVTDSDAVFGLIAETGFGAQDRVELRAHQLGATQTLTDILFKDPYLTLQMGHFVRTEVAARIRFDVEMDAGEDFKYYLELWRQARARKIESVLFVNRRGAHSVGPKSADGSQWRAATTRVLGDFCTRQGVSVSFPWEGRLVRFAVGNPMDLIHRHFIAGTFFEAEELRYLRTIVPPNATILEVGANVGNHLIYYALFMRAARIVPIEPNPAAVALLIKNLRLNQIRNVDISLLGFGIGAERGRFDLSIADGGNIGAARLLASEGGTVEVYPLDEKFDGRADFIKVDVEWMEMEALAGMEAIIARSRPILFIEIMNENIAAFEAWAEARDYRIIKIFANVNAKNFVAVGAEHPLAAGGA